MLSWKEVVACFINTDYTIIREDDRNQNYWGMSFLYRGTAADDRNILYLVHSSSLDSNRIGDGASLVVVQDDETDVKKWSECHPGGNLLLSPDDEEYNAGLRVLNSRLQDHFRIDHLLSKLQDRIIDDEGIQVLVNDIAEFFHAPAAVLDAALCFVAKSDNYRPDADKTAFPELINAGGFNDRVIEGAREAGVLSDFFRGRKSVVRCTDWETVCFTPIRINNVNVACLVLVLGLDSSEQVSFLQPYLSQIAGMLSMELSKNSLYLLNKESCLNAVFSTILAGDARVEDVRARFRALHYDLKERMYLVEIGLSRIRGNRNGGEKIAETMRTVFGNSVYVILNGRLFFLISIGAREQLSSRDTARWETALSVQHLTAAVAGPFADFHDIRNDMRKTQLLLRYSEDRQLKEHVLFFEENQIGAMIGSLVERDDLEMFMFRPVLKLADYDEKHGTDLMETLREYLRHPKEISEISETLHIHKNTLYKRLDRIREILSCDYLSGETVMRIELTMEMLQG